MQVLSIKNIVTILYHLSFKIHISVTVNYIIMNTMDDMIFNTDLDSNTSNERYLKLSPSNDVRNEKTRAIASVFISHIMRWTWCQKGRGDEITTEVEAFTRGP